MMPGYSEKQIQGHYQRVIILGCRYHYRRICMDKRMKISVWGFSGPLNILQDTLNKCLQGIDFLEVVDSDYKHPDIIYWVGGKGPSIKKYLRFWIKKNPIIINHWIGSDVTAEIAQKQHRGMNTLHNFILDSIVRWKMKRGGLINLVVAPWLVDELAQSDIPATCLPITTLDPHSLGTPDIQHAKDIDFLSYVQLRRFEFYGGDKIVKLAEQWKDYTFLVILGDITEISPDFVEKIPENVTVSPRVERDKMPELYQRSKFFIQVYSTRRIIVKRSGSSFILISRYYGPTIFPLPIKLRRLKKYPNRFHIW